MTDLEKLKRAEEAEPMAVLVMKWPEGCDQCDILGLDDMTDNYVCCAPGGMDVQMHVTNNTKPDWCPARKAIGIIEPGCRVRYFGEEEA